MMLKKQTVWLLTMLSLVVVLSVYYLNSDFSEPTEWMDASEEMNEDEETTDEITTIITEMTRDEAFEAIRMQLQDERSRQIEQLEETLASTDLTAEERSEAKDEMERLHAMAEKEQLLETLIINTLGYEDALVRTEGQEVSVTVKGGEPSKTKANEIIQLVKKELNTTFVTVAFQTGNETK
ncbi:SpoIIIAH-like family protein [Fervidibacillus albus]|uniref:SpoIIIAH-like family protein n=1 Tax=Fervidibacillus albus TaxID=2980026 RepID=A0A9E8RVA0_9BACI|nr:SpoIIIAH-like family protein [Fervidibacillus albus]WAA10455.1 SpoIIIAH-like family protein [Fervidibacillus albus]